MEVKNKLAWDQLSMQQKAELIKLGVQNGVFNIKDIRDTFNLYSSGGQEEILNKVNSSNANFVQRLKDPNRKNIPDWESSTDRISTHKLSVGTDENGNHYIFPEVQEINGELIDFTRPPYHRFAGEISAEMRGDTVRVSSLEDAIKFTESYKQYYPFNNGGNLTHKKSGEEEEESQDLNYPNGVIRQGKQDILKKIVQSPVGAFSRFVDPTGVLSIPDAYYDLKHLAETPTTQRTTADYIDAAASIVGLFPLGNNISDFVKVKNWRQGLQLANKYAEHLPFELVGVYPDMYQYNNQKSTGGPLYPFSFEKNPYFKTPVVRYDEGGKTYTVKSGDYLGKIAQANGITIADILAVNPGLNADKINIGQVLNLPGKPNITRQQLGDYIKTYKNKGWTEKDIDYLYSKLSTTDWDPSAIVYAMATESSFNPAGKNPVTSAKGLAQITDATMRSLYGTQAGDSINNLYTQKKVSTQDAINHAFDFYNYAAKKVTSERDDMGYGRLKTNLLAPNAGRDSKVSKAVKDNSLAEEQKGWANLNKTTYRDLAQKYDSVFNTDFYQPIILMKK